MSIYRFVTANTRGTKETVAASSTTEIRDHGDLTGARRTYSRDLPGPGESPILADFFDVFRDTHEKYPVSTEVGAWGGQEFVRILGRHLARKEKYPDIPPAFGMPYEGIENLRPETIAAVEAWQIKRAAVLK